MLYVALVSLLWA